MDYKDLTEYYLDFRQLDILQEIPLVVYLR